jgi:predicted RNA binding protein YcfA (HicA-like mRNA interferase family)
MTKLPQIRPRKIIKVLGDLGFAARVGKGSHVVYKHADGRRTVVPVHNRPVRMGTLRAILRQIDLSVKEFVKLLH